MSSFSGAKTARLTTTPGVSPVALEPMAPDTARLVPVPNFGDGLRGKLSLTVESTEPLLVQSYIRSPSGYLSNVSQ